MNTKLFRYLIITLSLVLIRCATVSAPPGGKKDETPPKIINSIPPNNSLNVKEATFYIFFDEKIAENKLKENLIINPQIKDAEIQTEVLGKKIKIKLLNKNKLIKLQDTTTYSIHLREGIKDITEGNIANQPKIRFSTGNIIDSNFRVFRVVDAFTKKPIEKVVVGLYIYCDSIDPRVNKPNYYGISDKNGLTSIENIKPLTYKIYAFQDTDKNNLYDPIKDRFYFDTIVHSFKPNNLTDTVLLDISIHDITKPRVLFIKDNEDIVINLSEGIMKYDIKSNVSEICHESTSKGKEIKIYKNQLCEDTVRALLYLQDSSYNDTTIEIKYTYKTPTKFKRYPNIIKEVLPKNKSEFSDSILFEIKLHEPIILNKDSIGYIIIDSIDFVPIYINKHFKINSANNYLSYSYNIKRKPKKYIQLTLLPKTFKTLIGDTNTSVTQTYFYKEHKKDNKNSEDDIVTNIKIDTEHKNFIYQFLDEKMQIVEELYNKKETKYTNLKPGYYSVRIIIDTNANKRWDRGKHTQNLLPEKIIFFKNIIKIIENWDVETQTIKF